MVQTASETAWDRIRRLKPVIVANRDEGDRLRRLPDAVTQAFLAADVYRLMVPKDLGGLELDIVTVFDLAVEVSSYDAAAGWNFGIGCNGPVLLGTLPLKRLVEIFSVPDCCMAGSGLPLGKAVAVDGGYSISGRWGWASAIHHSKWVGTVAAVLDGTTPRMDANGRPVIIFFVAPTAKVTILDTWNTGGLRGTGSTEWEASDLFVPESDVCRGPYSGKSEHPGTAFRLPSTYFSMMLSGVALGIAKSTVQSLKDLAAKNEAQLKMQGYAQYAVAKAEVLYESAHVNVREAARVIWDNTVANLPHSPADRARARRAYVHAVEASVEAVTLCVGAAGGAAIHDANPFHRALRDVHGVHSHTALSRRFMELAGQAAFGMPVLHPLF